jgi:hypothetical protein
MPAVTQVFLYSDPRWPEKVPAEEVVRVTIHWQSVETGDHGRRDVELYLTTAEREKLVAGNEELLAVGHAPGGKASAVALSAAPSAAPGKTKSMRYGPDAGPNSSERRDYWDGWKRWAESLGLKNKDGVHEVWETSTGSSGYHPVPVCDAYELHLQGRDDEALVKVRPYLPRQKVA